jgi:hypothetical protein
MVRTSASCRRDRAYPRGKAFGRRAVLAGGWAVAVGSALPGAAQAAAAIVWPSGGGSGRRFSVLNKGTKIGTHTILYSSATGEVQVSTDISLLAKVGFLTVFRFTHRSTEIWRAGRLVSLGSVTVEHGETLRVDGAATPQGFRVVSKSGPFIAPAASLTSNSLWTPVVLAQTSLVDAQHGGVIGVSARKLADEQLVVAGRTIRATRHSFISPYFAGSIWYDSENLWVHGEFERDGSKIQYELDS